MDIRKTNLGATLHNIPIVELILLKLGTKLTS